MQGAPIRPYFHQSIEQLEGLFTVSGLDVSVLRSLEQELQCRTTIRAAKLLKQVRKELEGQEVLVSVTRPGQTIFQGSQLQPARSVSLDGHGLSDPGMPALEDLGKISSIRPPKGRNESQGIIGAWIALEALSPRIYCRPEDVILGDRSCVARLSEGLPWHLDERSRPNHRLYYQVVLGSVSMRPAIAELIRTFGNDEEMERRRSTEKAALAVILVDKNGVVLEENGVSVSSFAWALPLALHKKLDSLGAWSEVESKLLEKLDGIVRRFDLDGAPLPLDFATIDRAHRWLVAQCGLPTQLIEPPSFVLRIYHHHKAKNPPEASLLNSYYLRDLTRTYQLLEQNAVPRGLRSYLGIDRPSKITDLLASHTALESAIAPAMMPHAKWPAPGGHPLVMLQQAAVNVAREELGGGEGILAVNGPPGTGKTTLLRDVVAACVLDRALAMASFEDPEKAFTASGERAFLGEKSFFNLYMLDPSLKGHEIVVASSNNKAVENISKELPAKKAIGQTTTELKYFKSVSDLIYSQLGTTEDEKERSTHEPLETWGLIAAVLGSAKNCAAFQQSFWWHEDYGFRLYLKAAKGDSVLIETKDPQTGKVIELRQPNVVLAENPPLPEIARTNWEKARTHLLNLNSAIEAELESLEGVRKICLRFQEARHNLEREERALEELTAEQRTLEATTGDLYAHLENALREHRQRIFARDQHRTMRPGLLARLLRSNPWKTWKAANAPFVAAANISKEQLAISEKWHQEAVSSLESLKEKIRDKEKSLALPRKQVAELEQTIDSHRSVLGDRLVDEVLFQKGHEIWNLASPWLPDSIHRKREEIFVAALAVHRAFVDVSAQKMLHNLSVLMSVFSSGALQGKRNLLGDLWSTLFLVIPVISTTFASVDRMLGNLPPGSIGWLLIDEAGQALPQASVGAILRAKRSIVVGDPLQIPPVVTLPERLGEEVCSFFKVDKHIWSAPDASAQILADRASKFQAAFRSELGPRKVGVPLLVHRRCQEPMFGISNRIAYDGQMVHAAGASNTGDVGMVLGASQWFDIDGDADSKWCLDEGKATLALLKKIESAGIVSPDIFIITPFRIVSQEMQRLLDADPSLLATVQSWEEKWARNRIGTIHTFQGREADSVILLLGAPKATQNEARSWAAGTPNILNVAVSRAKKNLYVVGSYGAWSGIGYARELALALPRSRWPS